MQRDFRRDPAGKVFEKLPPLRRRETNYMSSEKMTGAQLLIRSLIDEGTEHIFGYPGGAVIPIYDVIYDAPIKHVLTRHEQGAAHAADGYARATGKVGVCLATSGPGATNLVTGLSTAYMDSIPMVAITGQVPLPMIGNDSFQEADIYGISIPVTKYNYMVKDVRDLQRIIKEAFYIAKTGRPGPVLIDIPKDIQLTEVEYRTDVPMTLSGLEPETAADPADIDLIIDFLMSARRPVIYAGGGVISSGAGEELTRFVNKRKIPITTTLMGKGIYPEDLDLSLGMLGMHGTKYANFTIHESDLIIALGVRFDDRVAGNVKKFAPLAKIIHIDIDPAEFEKRMPVDLTVEGDLKVILAALNDNPKTRTREGWLERVARLKEQHALTWEKDETVKPQQIIETLGDITKGEIVLTTDVGQHQMWAALYYKTNTPRRFITSGGAGTMGYGFPAAVGAVVGKPELPVVAITGDGSFQMCIQELATVKMHNLPVKIFLFNNGFLGMVRQWQEIFHDKRYSSTILTDNPDFCIVAKGYGIPSFRVTEASEVRPMIEKVLAMDGPVLVDFVVTPEENVIPMLPPGGGQTEFIGEDE